MTHRKLGLWLGAALLAGALVPTVAAASRAEVRTDCERSCGEIARFVADPGEANRLTVSELGEMSITYHDAGSTIAPGRGCTSVDPHTVTCRRRPPDGPIGAGIGGEISTGDRADAVETDGFAAISTGSGNDRVRVGSAFVDAGPGNDRLVAEGGGIQELEGGSGNDRLRAGPEGSVLEGGLGNDRLSGRGGPDELLGGSGRDRLAGGRGRDFFNAGSGNDRIHSADRRRDRVHCGRGRDRVRGDRSDRLWGCERVRRIR